MQFSSLTQPAPGNTQSNTVLNGLGAGIHRHDAAGSHKHDHAVQFYDDDGYLSTVVGDFVADGLRSGQPTLIIATPEHRSAFSARLRSCGTDVSAARRSGQLQLIDARSLLARFMNGSHPDPVRFRKVVGTLVTRTMRSRSVSSVRAYGEMVDLLWKDEKIEGAIHLEKLWNDLADSHNFSLLCAYSMGNFCRATDGEQFRRICEEHSHVLPTEAYNRHDDSVRLREVALLQQRARAYEAEVVQRELVEQKLRETVIALREREQDLRDVLENAAEGIHLVGPDGCIQWANGAELEMLGYSASEYIGHNIGDFYVDRNESVDVLLRLAAGQTLEGVEVQLRHRDGSVRSVLVNSNVRWKDGQFVYTRCFSRDITAIRVAQREREQLLASEREARAEAERAHAEALKAKQVAEQANRAKSEFLAVMSHELRTPLNAIGGYAELMELGVHGDVTPQQRKSLERIQRSQRMLLGLINQVLNYARVETGNIHYELRDVPIDEALRTSESLITPQIRSKRLRYRYEGCGTNVHVFADEEKLQQIVLNLLTNALKFTEPDGSITMKVDCTDEHVLVHVIDTGIGIPPDKLETVFDPFIQVDPNYTRTHDGVGLGLAISRDLARGMGGALHAVSEPGVGSTFTLKLPVANQL